MHCDNAAETFIGGTGADFVNEFDFNKDTFNFSKGGTDTIEFHEARYTGAGLLTNAPPSTESLQLSPWVDHGERRD